MLRGERTGEPALATRHDRPAVAVAPIDIDELEDWMPSNAPEFVRRMRDAEEEFQERKTKSLDEVMNERRSEHERRRPGTRAKAGRS